MTTEKQVHEVKIFTDKELFGLYGKLKNAYDPDNTFEENLDTMQRDLFANFLPGGNYEDMSDNDKDKIYTVFTTFISTKFKPSDEKPAHVFGPRNSVLEELQRSHHSNPPTYVINYHYYQQSNWLNDFLFWHLCFFDTSSSRHHHQSSEDFLKFLLLILVIAVVAVALYFSACYLFTAVAETLERFWYNEGCLQASISLLSIISGALVGAMLMMAMIQPFGALAIVCIASASTIAAALTGGLTNIIQAWCIESMNTDAMDSADPYRFAITEAESVALIEKGIDPIKVKCAIAELRYQISELPSLTTRWFGDCPQQEKLQIIRSLRRGEMEELTLSDQKFNFKSDAQAQVVDAANDSRQPPSGVADGVPVGDDLNKPAFGYTG